MSVVPIMFLTFGLALLQVKMLPDALGLGSSPISKNISAVFMMLNRNIAELIPDHGNTQRKLDAGGLMGELQVGENYV